MATWRKVIVSGSDAVLNQISASGNIVPKDNNSQTLGTSTLAFGDLFLGSGGVINFNDGNATLTHTTGKILTNADISGSSTTTGSFGRLELNGDAQINGNITFGDADTDNIAFSGEISSSLIPNDDDAFDLGAESKAWKDLYLEGDIILTDAGQLKTNAGNLTIDSTAATLVLDGHTGVDIDATNSGKVTIDGAGGIDIGVASDVAIDMHSSTLDIDASGTVSIDASGGSITVGTNSSGRAITIGHTTSEVTIGDNLTVNGNATITGDLDVNGTLTTIDTTNLSIKDQLIFAASGSHSSNVDAGLLIQSGSVANTGSAFYHDINSERWAVAKTIAQDATAITPLQFMTTVTLNSSAPSSDNGDYGVGEMWIETDTQDIYIRTN
tara:strand:+ start:335 stop:1483 length:1149 start_codon:yes stop_codon:yes gene_type:complete